MSGHYMPISESSSSKRNVIIGSVAAAAVVLLVSTASNGTTQHWAATSSRTVNRPVSLRAAARYPVAASAAQVPLANEAAQDVQYVPAQFEQSQGSPLKVLAGAALTLGALFAFGRKLVSPEAAPIAMMATTSESKDDSKEKMRQMVDKLGAEDMKLLARGGSMDEVVRSKGIDEVAAAIRADQLSRKDLTPKDVILDMQRGNGRFWMGLSERPDMSAMERRALIMAQAPRVAILSCSDSRVPVEVIFDQGLGEVFVVRMAGNILDANAHGSIEFAVKYLGVKVVMVIGHEGCGAVKGAISMSDADIAKEPADLQVVLNSIKSKLNVAELSAITDSRSRDREAIVLNTSNQVKLLQDNPVLAEKVNDGSLLVCGAFYEISSGIVDFFSLDKNGFVVDM